MEQGKATFLLDPSHTVQKTPREISVAAGQTIMQALNSHGIVFRQPVVALVNGQTCDVSYCLQPGDVVRFFPQIAGG
ncbi:MAG: MoaD/ThiS family protein [Anaerolineae bacterium]|nr:MoaD/ThiS family protein [Anaerolineae bacterium]